MDVLLFLSRMYSRHPSLPFYRRFVGEHLRENQDVQGLCIKKTKKSPAIHLAL